MDPQKWTGGLLVLSHALPYVGKTPPNPVSFCTSDLKPTDGGGYGRINKRDPESATARDNRRNDDTYTSLKKTTDDTYREIAVKDKQRRRNKNDQVYQGLSAATKDTYDSLQMQPLPPPR
uniref:Uncharacterized protein n=1 Tax=Hucho hucho TaxID=62062 RepID=A0A4W5LWJ9_9TELE